MVEEAKQLAVAGIINGSGYALLGVAFGLILGVTGRFHYAFALAYTAAAYVASVLISSAGVPWPAALAAGLLAAVLLGVSCERVVYRPLAARSGAVSLLAIFIASLGISIAGTNIITLIWSSSSRTIEAFSSSPMRVGSVTFTSLELIMVIVFWVLIVSLSLVLRSTSLGRQIKAVRGNPELARVAGIEPDRIYLWVFAIGSLLSGVAALLLGMRFAVQPDMGTRIVVFAFVVAFLGGTASSPIVVGLAGLFLGLVESLSQLWVAPQWSSLVVFSVLFIYVALRPVDFGRFRVEPAARIADRPSRERRLSGGTEMEYWWNILDLILIYSVFSISLNLLLGYAGQVSVAHAAFGAIGGYLAAYLAVHAGVGFIPGLLIGGAGAALIGVFVSFPALRLSPEYVILLTIAVSSIVISIVSAVPALGGAYGIISPAAADLSPLPVGPLLEPGQWVVPLLVMVALTYLVCRRMGESAWGRVLRGIRDDEVAVRALGRPVFTFKIVVFGITAAFAGIAGVLLFYYNQLASPDVYGFDVSLAIFAMVIFGGLGNFVGAILGAAALQLLQPLLEKAIAIQPANAFLVQLVVYGAGLVLLMMLRPQGLLPEGVSLFDLLPGRGRRRTPTPIAASAAVAPPTVRVDAAAAAAPSPAAAAPRWADGGGVPTKSPLEVRGLEKSFGGIAACRGLDFDLAPGEITALVGPNGAGKTTVFNLLTGTIRADAGSVRLKGVEVYGEGPDEIARLGMVRSFQDVRLFQRMTTLENVMLGVREASGQWWRWPARTRGGENLADLFVLPRVASRVERETRERGMEWLDLVGLADVAGVPAAELSFGQQKLTSLARLLATDADVLLLDEPASGVDGRWVDEVLKLVGFMRAQGKTVCIVEHSLHVVEQLADTVLFMELGSITARGQIGELTADPRLAEVYFGTV